MRLRREGKCPKCNLVGHKRWPRKGKTLKRKI